MKKNTIIVLVALFILFVGSFIFLIFTDSAVLEGAVVAGQKKCLHPQAALNFIQDKGCVRIYEDQECIEKGFVEVQC